MKTLLKETTAYKLFAAEAARGEAAQTTLVLFPDGEYLRFLLKTFSGALFPDARISALIEKETFSDCHIYPAEGQKYSVETANDIVEESVLKPVEGDKVLFVLDAFDTALPIVQNKLLKLFEEPPEGVYFLIGATNEHAVLPTVLSRAKKYSIEPFSEKQIEDALTRNHVREEGIRETAAASGGIYSAAEKLLLGGGREFLEAEDFFAGKDVELLARSLKERKDKSSFFSALKLVARDLMLLSSGQGAHCARKTETMVRLSRAYPTGALIAAIGMIGEAERDVKFNANPAQTALALYVRIQKECKTWQKLS